MHSVSIRRWLLAVTVGACLAAHASGVRAEGESPADAAAGSSDVGAKPPSAWSEPTPKPKPEPDAAAAKRVVGQRTGKLLVQATELFTAERFDEAEAVLAKLRRMNPYEKALANRMQAYIAYAREDTDTAIVFLRKAIEDDALPPADRSDLLFQIAQLESTRQRWKEVAATMQQWFASAATPNAVAYHLLALAYYQMEDLSAALEPARQAVAIAEKPHQSALQLLLALYLTRKEYREATPLLALLLSHYPDSGKGYWLQLSSLYVVQEDLDRALAVLELAQRRGLLTDDADLRRLARLMLHKGMPWRAAKLVEEALAKQTVREDADAYELLSNGWILAREPEKSEQPLAQAAALSEKGDLYKRLGQVYLLQEEWTEAAAALQHALDKGGLEDAGSVELLLGVTCYNANRLREARSWFARAQQSSATRKQAETWLEHLQQQLDASGDAQTAG